MKSQLAARLPQSPLRRAAAALQGPLLVAFAIFLVATFPATWLLMLFLGNVGLGISYWGTLPLGVIVSLIGTEADPQGWTRQAEALGAQPYLRGRLFPREIDGASAGAGEGGGQLQQQCRLADAGLAADQQGGARHDAAAGDAVELGEQVLGSFGGLLLGVGLAWEGGKCEDRVDEE
jgi:hypothetical protein